MPRSRTYLAAQRVQLLVLRHGAQLLGSHRKCFVSLLPRTSLTSDPCQGQVVRELCVTSMACLLLSLLLQLPLSLRISLLLDLPEHIPGARLLAHQLSEGVHSF